MRFWLLLLLATPTFAQKTLTITDERNVPIQGVSVFLAGAQQELLAVSDEKGFISLNLASDNKYLIHSLGYMDTLLSGVELNRRPNIQLKSSSYQLNEVKAGLSKAVFVKSPPASGKDQKSIIDIPQNANKQRVIAVNIDTPGYLKSLKLFCKVQVKEVVPDYRFLLYTDKAGVPDSLLIPLSITGIKNRKEISFDLSKANFYLEKGKYFIGYETFNGKAIVKKQVHADKSNKQFVTVPIVIYSSTQKEASFGRHNLSAWYKMRSATKVGEKLVWEDDLDQNFAYELTLLN